MGEYGPPEGAEDIGEGVFITRAFDRSHRFVGIHEWHRNPTTGRWCAGWVPLDVPANDYYVPGSEHWQLVSVDPLTLSPSLLCRACQHHGYIRDGRWVPA